MTEDSKKNAPTDVPPATDESPNTVAAAHFLKGMVDAPAEASIEAPMDTPVALDAESAATPEGAKSEATEQDKRTVPPPMSFAGAGGAGGTGAINVAPADDTIVPSTVTPPPAAPAQAPTTSPSTSPTPPVVLSAGPAEHSFRLLSFVALFSLTLILAVQQFTSIYTPTVFTGSELGFAFLYENMLASGQWLTPPHLADIAPALPVYFWFMRLVDAIPYADASLLYPLVSAFSAFVALAGVYSLGLATGFGNRVAFAAGLILLSCLGFSPMAHYLSPDLLFAGTLALSMACLYRGWISQNAYAWLALGFMLAGISTLTGGLMGLIIPLFTSLGFVVWRGSFRRGHQMDAVFGFGLLLVTIFSWLGAVILLSSEGEYLYSLSRQIFAPFLGPLWPPQDPWWLTLVRIPVALLPWVLVVLFVPWGRVCATSWTSLKLSRTEKAGSAWLWIALFVGCLYVSITSSKPCLTFVPLLPLAVLLLAKALLNLPQTNSRFFFMLLALGFAVMAIVLGALSIPVTLAQLTPYIPVHLIKPLHNIQGLPIMAGVCLIGAGVLWKGTRRSLPAGSLLVVVLLMTILIQPATMMLSPSLQGVVGDSVPSGRVEADTAAAPTTENAVEQTTAPTTPSTTLDAAPTPVAPLAPMGDVTTPVAPATPNEAGAPSKAVIPVQPEAPDAAPIAPIPTVEPAESAAPSPAAPTPELVPVAP